jgi:hypothetical protein
MKRRYVKSSDSAVLRAKIDQAKRCVPLPELMKQLGLGNRAKKIARCPFPGHEDKHPSFSVFEEDGRWRWKCHAGCGSGDEIDFLCKVRGISEQEAVSLYLEMAGFPRESPELSDCSDSSECSGMSVSSVSSNGQDLQAELRALAARNRCTEPSSAAKKRFEVLRGLRAIAERIGRKLTNSEVTLALDEWYRLSQPFLDPTETRDHHLLSGLAELRKVRVPAGREAITQAIEVGLNLPVSKLPVISGMPDAPESLRRVAALHRELSRRSTNAEKTYFLGCRDAAKAHAGMSKSEAAIINRALVQLGVIEIVRDGERIPDGRASEYRYLLPPNENGAEEVDIGLDY